MGSTLSLFVLHVAPHCGYSSVLYIYIYVLFDAFRTISFLGRIMLSSHFLEFPASTKEVEHVTTTAIK